jgi:hypothetical protein
MLVSSLCISHCQIFVRGPRQNRLRVEELAPSYVRRIV